MTLPAFASTDDLAVRVPDGIEDVDLPRAQAALDDASSKVRTEAGKSWVADDGTTLDLPTGANAWRADTIVRVTLAAAKRVFDNPGGVTQQSLGEYSETIANSSSDAYLTAQERRDVRRAADSGFGAFSVDTAPALSDCHAEVCALRFGADYCSCGADITLGFPLYELP